MKSGDIPITVELGNPEHIEHYREVFFDSALYDNYFSDNDLLRDYLHCALENSELLAVKTGGELVGVMETRMHGFFGGFPYLALLGVKKCWRGKGIGSQMLGFFEEMARQSGFKRVSIMASGFNPRARRLYQNLGYHRIGGLDDAFRDGISENIYVKILQ